MPAEAGSSQKLKLLYLADIFTKESDEDHPLSVYDLSEKLEAMGIKANRKTLAEDISLLEEFGYDIISKPVGKAKGYYLGARDFELTELKLLADAVSSARFITEKKSRSLLKKLEGLAGNYYGQEINRRVYIANRVKSENELIYINVDTIQRAISEKCMIRFKYFSYTVSKKKQYRDGEYICSPYALTWNDGNYYMIAHYDKYSDTLSNFRVDRMEHVELLTDRAVKTPDDFDLPGYMNTTFSMFSGLEYTVKMKFDSKFVNAVLDKFGTDIMLIPCDDGKFTVNADIKPGPAFYGWIFQFGTGAEIISPANIRDEYRRMISSTSVIYEERSDL